MVQNKKQRNDDWLFRKLNIALAHNAEVTEEWLISVIRVAKKQWGVRNLTFFEEKICSFLRKRNFLDFDLHQKVKEILRQFWILY